MRRFLSLALCLALVLASFSVMASAADVTEEDRPLYEMMGFPDEDTFEVFLEFLSAFDGSTVEDMAAYLSGSEYGYMDIEPDFCLELYNFMVESAMPLTVIGSAVRFTAGALNDKQGALNISFQDGGKNYIFLFNNVPRVSNAYVIDFSQYLTSDIADQRYVTLASVSGLESKLNTIIQNQNSHLAAQGVMKVALEKVKDYTQYVPTILQELQRTGSDEPLLRWTGQKVSEVVGAANLYEVLRHINANIVRSADTNYNLMRLTDFPVFQFSNGEVSAWEASYTGNFSTVLGVMNNSLANGFLTTNENLTDYLKSTGDFLQMDGSIFEDELDLAEINQRGFLGLNENLLYALTGGRGVSALLTSHTVDSGHEGITSEEDIESFDLNNTLATIFNQWDLPIKQLQAVLADDADLELKRQTAEQSGAFEDTFIKPGSPGSVSPGDIAVMGSVSQDASSLLDTGVSVEQAFGQLNDASIFSFFTQETASDLDRVPATVSDDEGDWLPSLFQQQQAEFYSIIGGGE